MKFTGNVKGKGEKGKTENYEGGEAFVRDDESTLLNLVATCMMNEPKFYGEPGEVENKIKALAQKIDPKYLLQLAAYTRNELYMRSVSMYLLALAANRIESKAFVRGYAPKIIKRADELYEAMACYKTNFGKPFPNSLKKGIADSFQSFDEYQFGKYNRKTDFKFKDVIMLTHPKKPAETIKKILDDKLEVPYTWETELSAKGNKKEVWEELISSGRLPYMATLRNLRNILNAGVNDNAIDKVINYLKDEKAVKGSKQFPFRFFSAFRELEDNKHARAADILDAIEEAAVIAYGNIPHMNGTTLIACDVSGSMNRSVSKNSKIRHIDIGIIMGLATHKYTDKAIFGCFGTHWKTYALRKKTTGIVGEVAKTINAAHEVGQATNGYKVIKWLNDEHVFVDRVLMFTDEQLWNTSARTISPYAIVCRAVPTDDERTSIKKEFAKYKKNINPDVKMYMFNLNGYGTSSFPDQERAVVQINGWSDKVLNFIESFEKDPKLQVKYIKENY